MANKKYNNYTTSYSGVDMVVMLLFPGSTPITMGTATTLTYSIYRQIAQVRTLGRITSRGFARGGRSYAGTIIFTVIKEAFVEEVRKRVPNLSKHKKLTPDELPPVDVIITFANELGQSSMLRLYGLRFVDESKTLSIEDIFTENVLTFVCEEIHHMKEFEGKIESDGIQTFQGKNEKLGKFKVAELMANIEDTARKKRLQEIAAETEARLKEPVMSDPGVLPNFDPLPFSLNIPIPEGSGGAVDSGAQPDGSVTYAINIKVYEGSGTNKIVSGAKVSVKINDGTVTKTTDSEGYAEFGSILQSSKGKTLTFTISKDGYVTTTKSKKVGTNGTTETVPVHLQKKDNAPDGMGPLSGDVALSKKYGSYSNADSWNKLYNDNGKMKWRFNVSKKTDALQIQVLDKDGNGIEGIEVTWTYQIDNYSELGFKLFDIQNYKDETGAIGRSKTDKNGIATMHQANLGDWHNDARINIIAKPKNNKQNKSWAKAEYFQKWTFY